MPEKSPSWILLLTRDLVFSRWEDSPHICGPQAASIPIASASSDSLERLPLSSFPLSPQEACPKQNLTFDNATRNQKQAEGSQSSCTYSPCGCPLAMIYSFFGIFKVLLSILLIFLTEIGERPFLFRNVPFSFCGWGYKPGMKSVASLSNHENIHFPLERSFGFQVGQGLCLHLAQRRNPYPPPCEHTPCLSFLQSVTFLSYA